MKNLSVLYLLLIASLSPLLSNAQSDDVINSNRPGFSLSPYNVGKGIFQLESGLSGYLSNTSDATSNKSIGLDVTLRYATNDVLEFFANVTTQNKWVQVTPENTSSDFMFTPLSIGAFYRLNEGEKFIPTVAVGAELMYYQNSFNSDKNVDIGIDFRTQHDFAPRWVFISNWAVKRIIFDTKLNYTLSVTNTISQKWSWFVENFGIYSLKDQGDNSNLDSYFSAGVAHLFSDDIQFDIFGGVNLNNKPTYYISLGISWRLDGRGKYNRPKGAENVVDPYFNKE